ncbi:MAG: DUF2933 domain-containing protein [Acidimicrobiia bacterium]
MNNHSSYAKLILAAAVGLVVLAAFGVPVLGYLPLLAIVAICPLMMVFMMRGMDHGGGTSQGDRDNAEAPPIHRH